MHFIYFLKSIYYLLGWGKSKKKIAVLDCCTLLFDIGIYSFSFFSFFLEYIL